MNTKIKPQTEAGFQDAVAEYARVKGWWIFHARPARLSRERWATPIQYDGAGFPDLVMVRRDRILFVELKSEAGRVTRGQRLWLDRLNETAAEVHVFKPSGWGELEEVLA